MMKLFYPKTSKGMSLIEIIITLLISMLILGLAFPIFINTIHLNKKVSETGEKFYITSKFCKFYFDFMRDLEFMGLGKTKYIKSKKNEIIACKNDMYVKVKWEKNSILLIKKTPILKEEVKREYSFPENSSFYAKVKGDSIIFSLKVNNKEKNVIYWLNDEK